MITSKETNKKCNECNSHQLYWDPNTSELVCGSCGMVILDGQLSRAPEWRAFDQVQREKLPRVGSPLSLTIHDRGLSTTIDWKNRDHSGRRLSPEVRDKLYRLRKWNRRSKISNSRNRNLSQALSVITKLGNKLNLPRNVIETASLIYRRALKKNMIRGRTIQSIAVSCLYVACRQCGVLRSLTDVANAADISRKTAARNYRFLYKKLNLDVPRVQLTGYIRRLVSRLRLRGETEMLALRLAEESENNNLTNGRSPAGLAASCIYVSGRITGERLTQHQVALEAQVTEVTIRNRYKEMINNLQLEIVI